MRTSNREPVTALITFAHMAIVALVIFAGLLKLPKVIHPSRSTGGSGEGSGVVRNGA
ncbi:MAG: hypothetical protein ACK56I_27285 [bacterium]